MTTKTTAPRKARSFLEINQRYRDAEDEWRKAMDAFHAAGRRIQAKSPDLPNGDWVRSLDIKPERDALHAVERQMTKLRRRALRTPAKTLGEVVAKLTLVVETNEY